MGWPQGKACWLYQSGDSVCLQERKLRGQVGVKEGSTDQGQLGLHASHTSRLRWGGGGA